MDLISLTQPPINAVFRGGWHPYFGATAFEHLSIKNRTTIKRLESANRSMNVHFEDGTSIDNVDHVIFGTGYSCSVE